MGWAVVAHAFDPPAQRQVDVWEFQATLVGLQYEFPDSQGDTEKPSLKGGRALHDLPVLFFSC